MISNDYGVEYRQKELLEMIKQVDYEFKKLGIKYSIADGTLLGAIRHNGFIPWDDDIDIIISRNEYNKLVNNSDNLKNLIVKTYLWIPRIQRLEDKDKEGIMIPTIDIFIGDISPNNIVKKKMKVLLLRCLQGMMKEQPEYKNQKAFYKVCIFATYALGQFFSHDYMFRMYEKISQIGKTDNSEYIGFYNGTYKYVGVEYKKRVLDKFESHVFEDCELPITCEYDHYLTVSYGDYMTLPKENERKSTHVSD